ncbi:transposon Tn916 excisionase [Lachnospiraceae bacterium C10]|nr:transposon Tn916 excisionase [Lachnospiraceae bacterium C10]
MSEINMDIPVWRKVTLTKEEAAAYSHIGINKLEELLKIPNCPFVLYVGKKKLIKRKEFEEFIQRSIEV